MLTGKSFLIDTYHYSKASEGYDRRILGDVTGEMDTFAIVTFKSNQRQIRLWYYDEIWFICGYDFYVGSSVGVFSVELII